MVAQPVVALFSGWENSSLQARQILSFVHKVHNQKRVGQTLDDHIMWKPCRRVPCLIPRSRFQAPPARKIIETPRFFKYSRYVAFNLMSETKSNDFCFLSGKNIDSGAALLNIFVSKQQDDDILL